MAKKWCVELKQCHFCEEYTITYQIYSHLCGQFVCLARSIFSHILPYFDEIRFNAKIDQVWCSYQLCAFHGTRPTNRIQDLSICQYISTKHSIHNTWAKCKIHAILLICANQWLLFKRFVYKSFGLIEIWRTCILTLLISVVFLAFHNFECIEHCTHCRTIPSTSCVIWPINTRNLSNNRQFAKQNDHAYRHIIIRTPLKSIDYIETFCCFLFYFDAIL